MRLALWAIDMLMRLAPWAIDTLTAVTNKQFLHE